MDHFLLKNLKNASNLIAEFGLSHADDFPLKDDFFLARLSEAYDFLLSAISATSSALTYYEDHKKDL